MTTKLQKAVYRECMRFKDGGRDVIVGIEPGDVLTFRVKGLRGHPYRMGLEGLYHAAARARALG